MREALRYFFGAGTEPEFALFTPAHFAPIVLLVCVLFFAVSQSANPEELPP